MRSLLALLSVIPLLAPPLAAQGTGTLPSGWTVRADDQGDAAKVRVIPMGSGLHVTLGPAIILYREDTRGSGPFHTLATFTQTKKLEHAEGYGLFLGGQALDGEGERYTYFLVREDGSYLIKRREGEKTGEITKGWVPHSAVHRSDAKGSSTNLLEVDAKQDPTKVVFKVNGQAVYTAGAKEMDLTGVVGLRVNHHLDVHVEGFGVHR